MLSRREREFLENPASFPKSEKRIYRLRIRRKIQRALRDLELINDKMLDHSLPIKIMGKSDRPSKPGVGGSSPPGPVN